MARIFVSYKRQDKDIVYPIVEEIKQNTGIDCWIDLEGIESGDQFQNVIIDAIDNADIVVFMLSKNFIAPYRDEITGEIELKKQTFPEKEVMYALRHNKRLIPISIDGTTVYDCKWLEFNCSGLDCINWGVEEQQIKLLNNLRQWTGNKHTTNAFLNTHHSSGTFLVESHPGYACLHINVDETCKIYRFGKQIGEIKGGDWGELYLRMGDHELSFVSEKNLTVTKIVEIPSAEYTDFIHIGFSKKEVEESGTNKNLSSTDKKQGLSFSINTLRKNKGCSIALTVAFVLCVVVLPLGYLSFERNDDKPLIAGNTNDYQPEESSSNSSNPSFTGRPDRNDNGVTATHPIDEIEFVDLGLPSKTLWADRNIGANKESDYGDLYSWGETSTKKDYRQSCYEYIDANTIIGTKYDVATQVCGQGYQMPTQKQFDELIKECNWQWEAYGYRITATNGNSIYLPASGWSCSSSIEHRDVYGYYWTGNRYNSDFAKGLLFSKSEKKTGNGYLYYGRAVRPVRR